MLYIFQLITGRRSSPQCRLAQNKLTIFIRLSFSVNVFVVLSVIL